MYINIARIYTVQNVRKWSNVRYLSIFRKKQEASRLPVRLGEHRDPALRTAKLQAKLSNPQRVMVGDTWSYIKQLLGPRHRKGIKQVQLKEGEHLFMKIYEKDEADLKAKQHIFVWHYLALGFIGSLVTTSDCFMFDIITLLSITSVAFLVNRKYHKDHTNKVLEIVLLPENKVRVKTLTSLGFGKKTSIHPIEDCDLSKLDQHCLIGGVRYQIDWSKAAMLLDETLYQNYEVYETSVKHKKYISSFHDVDNVQTSKNLFAKKNTDDIEFIKVSDGEFSESVEKNDMVK